MPNISDIIQAIARQRGRGDTGPLIMLRQLDGTIGDRISHLPVDTELAQAWVALTSEPFRPHQAQALTALRRGEPVVLSAQSNDVAMTASLLLYAMMHADPQSAALLFVPDLASAERERSNLVHLNEMMPHSLRLSISLPEREQRPNMAARVFIVTPEMLHHRMLRHHDRAWRQFWPRLRLMLFPDIHHYTGVQGAHLTDLLLRAQRVAATHARGLQVSLLATMASCNGEAMALEALLGQPWRIVGADDGPSESTALAVWRGGSTRLREAADLAIQIRKHGYHVHVACSSLEAPLLAPLLDDEEDITWGPAPTRAHVLLTLGYPGSISHLRRMLRSEYQAVVVVLGDTLPEQAIAHQPERILNGALSSWPEPALNAYVVAQHVLCAANELPLTAEEVEAWGVQEIVDRLVNQGHLVDLPDPEVAWKPTSSSGDPYGEFSMLAASGSALLVKNDQGLLLTTLDPTAFERWTFPGAALPSGAGGYRVLSRDEDGGSLIMRQESNGRRTYPLRRCKVTVREERDARMLMGGRALGVGRVVVDEEMYGYREASNNAAAADLALQPSLTARWTAPACWFDLGGSERSTTAGQVLGWCLAATLPLRTLAKFTEIVPCYDPEARRIYFVDAQPGGSGLAAWIYANAEELLPLAYDVALACRNDPLLEPFSRADQDWLLMLLGRASDAAQVSQPMRVAMPEPAPAPAATQPRRFGRGETPTAPRVLYTPQPAPEPQPEPEPELEPEPEPEPPVIISPPSKPSVTPSPPSPPSPSISMPANSGRDARQRRDQRREQRRGGPSAPEPQRPEPQRPAARAPEPQRPTARAPEPPDERRERPSRERPSFGQPAPPPQPPPEEETPDPAALIARLRRQREQRERHEQREQRDQRPSATQRNGAVELRFAAGDEIFCLPYGDGVVRESRAEKGREILLVDFTNHGELTIDPAVNFVRKQASEPEEDDLL